MSSPLFAGKIQQLDQELAELDAELADAPEGPRKSLLAARAALLHRRSWYVKRVASAARKAAQPAQALNIAVTEEIHATEP